MDTALLVEKHIEDGRILIAELLHRKWSIAAAFWNQDIESYRWKLYVSMPEVKKEGTRSVYLRLTKVIKQIQPRLSIDVDDIKLIPPKHGVVQTIKLLLQEENSQNGYTKSIHLGGDPQIIGPTICYRLKNLGS